MILNFEREPIENNLLTRLVDAVNSTNDRIYVYISSNGGKTAIMQCIIDLINRYSDQFYLIGYDYLASAAFNLFITVKCEKTILPRTIGMYHLGRTEIDIDDRGRPFYLVDTYVKERCIKYDYPMDLEFIKKCGFTKTETTNFKKNSDVYFQYDRFLEIIESYKNS